MEVKPFRYSYRTYLDNPQHVKINQILQNLDKINYKSKNKFISDAIEYYIDHLTSEGVVDVIEDKRFVTEEEMLQLKKVIQENTISLVKDEIIKSLASIITGVNTSQTNIPVQIEKDNELVAGDSNSIDNPSSEIDAMVDECFF